MQRREAGEHREQDLQARMAGDGPRAPKACHAAFIWGHVGGQRGPPARGGGRLAGLRRPRARAGMDEQRRVALLEAGKQRRHALEPPRPASAAAGSESPRAPLRRAAASAASGRRAAGAPQLERAAELEDPVVEARRAAAAASSAGSASIPSALESDDDDALDAVALRGSPRGRTGSWSAGSNPLAGSPASSRRRPSPGARQRAGPSDAAPAAAISVARGAGAGEGR